MLIADRYQLLDAGRPGAAVRARDLQTAQTVLLRERRLPKDDDDGVALARAQAARGIFHPSLVTLFDVTPLPDRRVLLAYEYVPAQSLAQVSGGHPFNARRAAELATEIADALAELHARGVVHGGISQNTVLVTLKGKAKLDRVGDFSLSMSAAPVPAGDLRSLGDLLAELVGTPAAANATLDAIGRLVGRLKAGEVESAAVVAGHLRGLSH